MKMGLMGCSDLRWRSPTTLMPWASKSAQHAVTLSMDLTRPVRLLFTYPWPQRQSQVSGALEWRAYGLKGVEVLDNEHTLGL